MSTNNPISFRFPFASQVASLPPEVQQVHKTTWNAITDLQGAIPVIMSHINALKTTTAATAAAVASNVTENITTINTTVLGGVVNDQTGNTTYVTQQSDAGALIVFDDAAPVAVSLNPALTIPWYSFPINLGISTVTLTPLSGTISYAGNLGASSMPILPGYFAVLFLDGTDFWGCTLPIAPQSFVAIPSEWLNSYDSSTGLFTASQPTAEDVIPASSTTGGRPAGVAIGFMDFDTTLGIPIWWNGAAWIDASGTPV